MGNITKENMDKMKEVMDKASNNIYPIRAVSIEEAECVTRSVQFTGTANDYVKKCNKCLEYKTVDNFNKDCTQKYGLKTICRNCNSIKNQEKNQEKLKERFFVDNVHIGLCMCGKYFQRKSFSLYSEGKIYEKCITCRRL